MATELLKIEDRFTIKGRGVVLLPDFEVPDKWENQDAEILVVTPSGAEYSATAQFYLTHFNISDPSVPSDRRWRIVVMVTDRTKDDLPVGSVVSTSDNLVATLLPGSAA